MNAFMDHMLWREEVSDWTVNFNACAHGGENKAEGTMECLELIPHRSIIIVQKEHIKLSACSGEVILKPGEEGTEQKKSLID